MLRNGDGRLTATLKLLGEGIANATRRAAAHVSLKVGQWVELTYPVMSTYFFSAAMS